MWFYFRRSSLIPNREKLKTFIRSYAFRLGNRADSPWVFYDNSIVEKYQVKERLSSTVIEEFKKSTTITLDVNNDLLIKESKIRVFYRKLFVNKNVLYASKLKKKKLKQIKIENPMKTIIMVNMFQRFFIESLDLAKGSNLL